MKRNYLFNVLMSVAFIVFITLVACSSDTKINQDAQTQSIQTNSNIKPEFSDLKVKQVFSSYIQLKNAMYNANTVQVKLAAVTLQTALVAVANKKGADLSSKVATAPSIGMQRGYLTALSSEVENVIKGAKLASGVVYKQFCPMANDGNGGFWLANESAIKNPYYGDQMSSCGSVKEEIR